ncbi:Oidioi.mRNA.OKI2018_I69.PAR.g9300.t1.cds [Oikopleura dioica]|uniref:Oidioi.mRNA.OKI2018_I69.PAR.g9300.t1.cds n=1 Tax=Oikopleura dioica TaxID=34765 RepID=A0ABN7RSM2_OIKDI|nr:Oidioi.mRNA.OKI2018_I69.PAR.g9300.t1.cds [Oikopleura dioica]
MIVLDSAEPDRFCFIERIKASVIFLDETSLRSDIVLNHGVNDVICFGASEFKLISEKKITKFEAESESDEEAKNKIEKFIDENISFKDIGFYTTTSGSTGVPKIIKVRNSTNYASLKWATNPKGPEDVPKLAEKFGADLPNIMAHINNVAAFVNFVGHIMVLFLGLLMEGPHLRRNLLLCDQNDLKSSLAAIAAEKCGGVWGYTPKIIRISESQELKEIALPSVSLFIAGGAKMTAEHMRRITANFAAAQNGRKCHVLKIYGSTEMGSQLFRTGLLETDEFAEKTDGIFCSNKGYQCEVRDSDGKVLPPGEVGQIFVKSPDLMIGYLGFPNQGEWYAMGDEGYLTEENRVVVLGRLSDQITLVNTKKSNALELEDRMYKAGEFVKSVVVLSKRNNNAYDDIYYLVYCDETDDEKVKEHVKNDILLLTKEQPTVIFVREPFEVLVNGKIDKKSLAAKYIQ